MAGPWEKYGAAPQQVAPTVVGNPNPYKQQEQQMGLTKGALDIQRGQADLATAPFDAQKAQADARKAQLELEAMEKKAADPTGALGVEQSRATGFLSRATKANQAYEQTGVGSQGYGTTILRAIAPESLEPAVIGPERQQAEANVRAFISSILRYESGAAIPPEEFESAYKTYFPQTGEDEATAQTKARLRAEAIEALALGSGPGAAQIERPSQQLTPSTNGTSTEDDPNLAGVRGKYLEMLGSGATPDKIMKELAAAGVPMDAALRRSVVEQYQFRKKNPGVPLDQYNTNVLDDRTVALTPVEGAMNDAAQSALGAYAMRAGNAVTGNNLDSIVGMTGGNAERARIGLDDAGEAHPLAALAGDVSGGVIGALGGEAALGRAGMASGVGRAMIADTGYGAVAGAGASDDGNRLAGAGMGAAAGLAGSALGQGATKALGSAVSPTGGDMAKLYASGVRPTPGQRLVNAGGGKGIKGLAGRALNNTEEALSSVPIVGAAIRGARQDARDQFQLGAFNEALKDIGYRLPKGMQPGNAPHKFAQKAFDKVYDRAREGMRLAPDDELAKDVSALSAEIANLAETSVGRWNSVVKNVVQRRIRGDALEGAEYKAVQSELGKIVRGIRKSPSGDGELADAIESLQAILDNGARRHSDPKAVKLMDAADRGYAKLVRIEEAAAARGGNSGTFTPTQFDRAVQKNGGRVRSRAYLEGDALMQDYAEQGMSLADRLPNSGTNDRALAGLAAAGGAGFVEPSSLGLLGAVGLAYAPGARKALAGSMAPRGAKAKAVAEEIRKAKRLAGAAGAGAALSGSQTSGGQ